MLLCGQVKLVVGVSWYEELLAMMPGHILVFVLKIKKKIC